MPTQAPTRALLALSAVVGVGVGLLPGCPDPGADECQACMNVQDVCCVDGHCVGCGPEPDEEWVSDESDDESSDSSSAEAGCDDCGPALEDCGDITELTGEPVATLDPGATLLAIARVEQPGKQLVALGPGLLQAWLADSWVASEAADLELDAVYPLDLDQDGVDELLTIDRTAREIRHFRAQGLGVYAAIESFPLELDYPAEPSLDALVFDYLDDGDPDLFVIDRGFVWLLHNQAGALVFESIGVEFSGIELRPLTTYRFDQLDGEFVVLVDALSNDADARLRTWPVWQVPTFKADALAGIEQGVRIDEDNPMSRLWARAGASTLQTWAPQYAGPTTFELDGPAEILGFARPEGDALAIVQDGRVRVIEHEQCAWQGTLAGEAGRVWQVADLDDDGVDELVGHSPATGAVVRYPLGHP